MRKTHYGHAACAKAGTSDLKKLTPGQFHFRHVDSFEVGRYRLFSD
jgi:hypothetical protein